MPYYLYCLRLHRLVCFWSELTISNRKDDHFFHHYDIVFGAVANDQVYAAISLFEAGFLNKQGLLENLKTWKYTDQYCFHTEKSLSYLQFIQLEILENDKG